MHGYDRGATINYRLPRFHSQPRKTSVQHRMARAQFQRRILSEHNDELLVDKTHPRGMPTGMRDVSVLYIAEQGT